MLKNLQFNETQSKIELLKIQHHWRKGICFQVSYYSCRCSVITITVVSTTTAAWTTADKSKNITNNFSRARGHLLRYNHDCIITSSSTVIDDNPELTCRIPGLQKFSPARIILDSSLKVPINHNIILFFVLSARTS